MQEHEPRKPRSNGEIFALIVGAFALLFAMLLWSPWNPQHVASNPGPSGTPGSTAVEQAPPPAASPSGNTTGTAR